ncbi:glycosyltransferase [Gordonia bronchialis]|uniref:glycosyltransferase n=1 Tax=Gordonia bronchialis TaxID=2054 RepID=UPI0022716134|nr:glycosyltransferase [Gordonia bronchialis]
MVKVKPARLQTRPKVSIVVTCYNYGDYLEDAVTSALDQSGVDLEVIVADNGSTDQSLEIAEKIASADSRVQIRTQPENIHPLVNFNQGLAMTTGDYVQVLCADDMLTTDSITRAVAVMEARPDVVFTYGNCPTFVTAPPRETRQEVRAWSIWSGLDWVRARYRAADNLIHHPEVLMRTSTLRDIGGYNPDFRLTSDMLLWMQAALRGNVARIDGPDQAFYRIHGQNLHIAIIDHGLRKDLEGKQAVFDALPRLDPDKGVTAADVDAARLALANEALRYACRDYSVSDDEARELGDSYLDYAREVCPDIQTSLRWRQIDAARRTGATLVPRLWRYRDSAEVLARHKLSAH